MAAALDVQKLQADQAQDSFFAFATSLGDPEAFKRAWEEILDVHCSKGSFLRNVFNVISTFGVHGTLKTFLKAATTHALSHRYSNFDYDMEILAKCKITFLFTVF